MPSVPHSPGANIGQLASIYVRVSSKEQVEGYSLDAQRRACRDFCAARGYTIVAEYTDEGLSAHTDNLGKRPDFARVLAGNEELRSELHELLYPTVDGDDVRWVNQEDLDAVLDETEHPIG